MFRTFNLHQKINEPTKALGATATLIDNIFLQIAKNKLSE